MLRLLYVLAVTAGIVACPLRCLNLPSGSARSKPATGGCACCHPAPESPVAPASPSVPDEPCGKHLCICTGAVDLRPVAEEGGLGLLSTEMVAPPAPVTAAEADSWQRAHVRYPPLLSGYDLRLSIASLVI